MSAYRIDFDENKYMSFLKKDNKLLEKYDEISIKVSNGIKKEFNREPVYNGKYCKTKIKSHKKKINTNFHNNKIPKEGSQCICSSTILLDSVYRKDNYYPQMFLEECKYVVKEKKRLT